jgi:ribosome-binding protein aMBF1 (putative translation factor)
VKTLSAAEVAQRERARLEYDAMYHPDPKLRVLFRQEQELEREAEAGGEPAAAATEHAIVGPGFYAAPAVAQGLADALRTHRKGHGLSQRGAARKLGLYQSQVARLESGDRTPELETLVRVARELGLTLTVRITPEGATLEVAGNPR